MTETLSLVLPSLGAVAVVGNIPGFDTPPREPCE